MGRAKHAAETTLHSYIRGSEGGLPWFLLSDYSVCVSDSLCESCLQAMRVHEHSSILCVVLDVLTTTAVFRVSSSEQKGLLFREIRTWILLQFHLLLWYTYPSSSPISSYTSQVSFSFSSLMRGMLRRQKRDMQQKGIRVCLKKRWTSSSRLT